MILSRRVDVAMLVLCLLLRLGAPAQDTGDEHRANQSKNDAADDKKPICTRLFYFPKPRSIAAVGRGWRVVAIILVDLDVELFRSVDLLWMGYVCVCARECTCVRVLEGGAVWWGEEGCGRERRRSNE